MILDPSLSLDEVVPGSDSSDGSTSPNSDSGPESHRIQRPLDDADPDQTIVIEQGNIGDEPAASNGDLAPPLGPAEHAICAAINAKFSVVAIGTRRCGALSKSAGRALNRKLIDAAVQYISTRFHFPHQHLHHDVMPMRPCRSLHTGRKLAVRRQWNGHPMAMP